MEEFTECCSLLRIMEFDDDFDPKTAWASVPNRSWIQYMTFREFKRLIAGYFNEGDIQYVGDPDTDDSDENTKSETDGEPEIGLWYLMRDIFDDGEDLSKLGLVCT